MSLSISSYAAALKWQEQLADRQPGLTGAAITCKMSALNQMTRVQEDIQQDEAAWREWRATQLRRRQQVRPIADLGGQPKFAFAGTAGRG